MSLNLVTFSISALWVPKIPIIPWARAMFSALGAQGATFRILTNFSDFSHFDLSFSILVKRRPGMISSLGVEGNDPLSRVTFAQTWKSEKSEKKWLLDEKVVFWWKLRKWADFSIFTFPDPKSTSKTLWITVVLAHVAEVDESLRSFMKFLNSLRIVQNFHKDHVEEWKIWENVTNLSATSTFSHSGCG